MSQPTTYDRFNYLDDYKKVVIIGGRQDEDWSYNLSQDIQDNERQALGDIILKEGAICSGTPTYLTGEIEFDGFSMYLQGRVEPIPEYTRISIASLTGNIIYAQWSRSRINYTIDDTLVDPNNLSPVFETDKIYVQLSPTAYTGNIANPDVFDENFEIWGVTSELPINPLFGSWTVPSGQILPGCPAATGRFAMEMIYNNGVATTATSPTFPVAPSTTYYVYFQTKTVYGQTDLQLSDGAFFEIEPNVSPSTTINFATTGGTTLVGGYTQSTATFTTGGSDNSAHVTISIPSTATPSTTQILVDTILITTYPLASNVFERHYYPAFLYNSSTQTVTPYILPKSNLNLTDLSGTLPATDVSFTPDSGTAPDISAGTAQTAIDQLSTQRALLGGSATQTFEVANATAFADAPNAGQVVQASLVWCGASTNSGNTYNIAIPTLTSATFAVGQVLRFIANATNSGPVTLNISGTPFSLIHPDGTSTQAEDLILGGIVTIIISQLVTGANLAQIYAPASQYVTQADPQNYVIDVGAANAYVVALSPAPIAITAGFPIRVLVANTNTGASTITVNSTLYNIKRTTGVATLPNDFLAGGVSELVFDGTNFQLVSTPGGVLQLQEIFGVGSATRGSAGIASNQYIGTTTQELIEVPLIMPDKGVSWMVEFHAGVYCQMLTAGSTTGSNVDVTISMTDGTLDDAIGEGYTLCTANNQAKKVHITGSWHSGFYSPAQPVLFTLQIIAAVNGTISSPTNLPQALAGSTTFLRWVIMSAG